MLATTPTLRQAALAFENHFVGPWAQWPIATAVLVLAAAGLVYMVLRASAGAVRPGGGVRSLPGLRSAVPGNDHHALRAAARHSGGLPRRPGRVTSPATGWPSLRAWRSSHSAPTPAIGRCTAFRRWRPRRSGCWATCTPPPIPKARPFPPLRSWRCIVVSISTCAGPFQWVGDRVPQFSQRLADASQARVAGGGEVLEQRRPGAGLVHRRSAAQRSRALQIPPPPGQLPMAVLVDGSCGRRATKRDGLARPRVAGLVSRRGVGASRRRPPVPPARTTRDRALARSRGGSGAIRSR